MFRTELSLTVVSEIATIATDEYILRQAFDSLFRGLHSAFRTTAFELSQGPRVAARDQEPLLVLALKEPAPDNFARATDLVRINVAMSRHRRMDAAIHPSSSDITVASSWEKATMEIPGHFLFSARSQSFAMVGISAEASAAVAEYLARD